MASIEQINLRQEAQRRKENAICEDYQNLKKQYPEAKAYTLFDTLAEKYRKKSIETPGFSFPITGMGIREVIIRNGLYKPQTYKKQ